MNTSALVFMLVTLGLITGFTIFFFVKMLTSKPENDPENRSSMEPTE